MSGGYKVGDNAPSNTEKKPKQTTTPRLAKLSSLVDSGEGCEKRTSKVSVLSPLSRQNTERSCNARISCGPFRSEGKIHPAEKCSQNQV